MDLTPRKARPEVAARFVRLAAVVSTAGFAAALLFGGEDGLARWVDDIGLTLAPLLASALCVAASRRAGDKSKRAWLLLGGSALSWALGNAVWAFYEIVLGRDAPFPSPADIGYLGSVPFAVAAMLSFPSARTTIRSRLRMVLDAMLIGGSVLFVSWATVLGPLYRAHSGTLLQQLVSLAQPLGDAITMTILILVAARTPVGARRRLLYVGAGLFGLVVADSAFAWFATHDTYASGNLFDIGWFIGFVLIAAGTLQRVPVVDEERELAIPRRGGVALPYIPFLFALAIVVVRAVAHVVLGPFLVWNGLTVVLLVLSRQFLTLLENLSLTRNLDTKVRQRTAALAASEQRFRSLVQNSSDVTSIIEPDGTISYISASIEHVLGYQPEERVGTNWFELVLEEDRESVVTALAEVIRRRSTHGKSRYRASHADGRTCVVETTTTNLLHDENVRGIVLNTRDVTEETALQQQLMRQAFHDPLTDLANRALFRNRLEHALAARSHDRPIAVVLADLDGFKAINDSLGHMTGDELLREVGRRLQTCVRPADTVARLGGDEFAMLVEGFGSAEHVLGLGDRIMEALKQPVVIEGREVFASVSMGVAFGAPDGEDFEKFLGRADVALYAAKAHGKGRISIYEKSMHEEMARRLQTETDLRRAIDRDELVVHYQPIIDLASGRCTGVEALVRWNHPTRGLLAPAEFIDVAEESGLIVPLGWTVLRWACSQVRAWDGRDRTLSLSVNLSARQIREPDAASQVAAALSETGLDPSRLVLEITESVAMDDSPQSVATLEAIRTLGVHLAIDDFGTGYSSLGYLRKLPVQILKIDRTFVDAMYRPAGPTSSEDRAIAQAIVTLAHRLGLRTVAEGIEYDEQLVLLRALGCDAGQGFLISRPVPADVFERTLKASVLQTA